MQDQLLKCKNCDNPFVYSVYEQIANQKKALNSSNQSPNTSHSAPMYCPICQSIKASEQKHPPKPKKITLQ